MTGVASGSSGDVDGFEHTRLAFSKEPPFLPLIGSMISGPMLDGLFLLPYDLEQ